VALADRGGLQRGKVGARARLGITLAPPALSGENLRQMLLLLLVVAEGVDDGADHGDAERQDKGRVGSGAFLAEDVFLRRSPAGAAVFLRPGRGDPALLVERAVPGEEVFLALVLAARFAADLLRVVLRDEGFHFAAEGLVGRGEVDVHG